MLWPSEVLPTPGRPDEAQDRTAALRVELAHGQVLDDALLDLLETVVIGVEDAARAPDVDVLGVELRPRHGDQRVEVSARHRVLAARLVHPLEPLQLLAGMLLDIRRHPGLGDRLGQLSDLIGALTVLAQFLADLAHLLAQQDLLLAIVERFLGLLLDLPRELEHLDAPGEQGGDALETVLELGRLQELLFVGNLDVEEARDHVGEHRRRLDRLDAVGELRGRLRQQRYRLHGLLFKVQRPRLDIGIGGAGVGQEFDPRH